MTMQSESRMLLAEAEAAEVAKAQHTVADDFLDPARVLPNVNGLAAGIKWKDGRPTGEPAILVLVDHKVAPDELAAGQAIPKKLGGMQTDVLAIGSPTILPGDAAADGGIQTLARRIRPAEGGYSVGHYRITAGTIASCVYDILPGGGVSPPVHGVGVPARYYILSNNHVLANSNLGLLGDPVLQPGPYDGGVDPSDRIARLSRFIPLVYGPTARNLVDAAIAEGPFHDLDREIYWIGTVDGWRRRAGVTVGMTVMKTGRTTNFTTGRVTAINAIVSVGGYPGGPVRFVDQIVTTNISAGGDSGSLVLTRQGCCRIAVGLLFAGSSVATIVNQIENVRALLRVEVADQML
jgi:hypothetical protein